MVCTSNNTLSQVIFIIHQFFASMDLVYIHFSDFTESYETLANSYIHTNMSINAYIKYSRVWVTH